jgi:hypothetical protein
MLLSGCATVPQAPPSRTLDLPELGARVVVVGAAGFVIAALPAASARLQAFDLQLKQETAIVVDVDVYAFVRATGQTNPALRAWSTDKTVHLLPPSTWRDSSPLAAEKKLAHELCHVALWQAHPQARIPRFVVEGLCSVVADQESSRQPRASVIELLREGREVDFDDDTAFSYGLAHHTFAAVFRCRGNAGLHEIVDVVAAGGTVEAALGKPPLQVLAEPCP